MYDRCGEVWAQPTWTVGARTPWSVMPGHVTDASSLPRTRSWVGVEKCGGVWRGVERCSMSWRL